MRVDVGVSVSRCVCVGVHCDVVNVCVGAWLQLVVSGCVCRYYDDRLLVA